MIRPSGDFAQVWDRHVAGHVCCGLCGMCCVCCASSCGATPGRAPTLAHNTFAAANATGAPDMLPSGRSTMRLPEHVCMFGFRARCDVAVPQSRSAEGAEPGYLRPWAKGGRRRGLRWQKGLSHACVCCVGAAASGHDCFSHMLNRYFGRAAVCAGATRR